MSEQRIYSQSVTDHTLRQWETLRQSHLDSVVFDLSSMSLEEAGAERQKGTRKSLIKIVDPRVVGHTIVRDESGMKTPMGIPFIGPNLHPIDYAFPLRTAEVDLKVVATAPIADLPLTE